MLIQHNLETIIIMMTNNYKRYGYESMDDTGRVLYGGDTTTNVFNRIN